MHIKSVVDRIASLNRLMFLRRLMLLTGSMSWFNEKLEPLGFLDLFNSVFRGVSQLIFINNPLAGAGIALVIIIEYPFLGAMGLFGCFLTSKLAISMGFPVKDTRNGVFGFGGALIGFALSVLAERFSTYGYDFWLFCLLIFPLSYLNTLIIKELGFPFSKKTGLPFFTLPYNFSVYFLVALLFMIYPDVITGGEIHFLQGSAIGLKEAVNAAFVTFGQVFFVSDLEVSIFLFLITFICSPISAIYAMLGAAIFVIFALCIGFDNGVILSGTIGYNVVLTALVVGAVVHIISIKSLLISMAAAIWSSIVSLSLASVLMPLGIPILTLPFCLATMVCLFVLWKLYPGWLACVPDQYRSPEENFYLKK
ncbi:urea transporter [Neptunomonas sp.]|uniref:urea transporter n=1 Tax=Neptunomonas sp. TaxID=1971898 RepID=UPI003569997E